MAKKRELTADEGIAAANLRRAWGSRPRGLTQEKAAAELGQRERVVLRDALRRPQLADGQTGKFIGEIRELDMDKTRFHLRGVRDIGTLRCVLPEVPDSRQAKALMGETVAVSGRYATDTAGRPRLLLVESLDAIRVIAKPVQSALI